MRIPLTPLQIASLSASGLTAILLGFVFDFGQIGRLGRTVAMALIFFLYMWSVIALRPAQEQASSLPVQLILGILVAIAMAASRQSSLAFYALAIPFGIAIALIVNWLARNAED